MLSKKIKFRHVSTVSIRSNHTNKLISVTGVQGEDSLENSVGEGTSKNRPDNSGSKSKMISKMQVCIMPGNSKKTEAAISKKGRKK